MAEGSILAGAGGSAAYPSDMFASAEDGDGAGDPQDQLPFFSVDADGGVALASPGEPLMVLDNGSLGFAMAHEQQQQQHLQQQQQGNGLFGVIPEQQNPLLVPQAGVGTMLGLQGSLQQHHHQKQQQQQLLSNPTGAGGATAADLQQQVQQWQAAFLRLARMAGADVDPAAGLQHPPEHYIQQVQAVRQRDPVVQAQAREAALQVQNAHLSRENLLLRRELCCGWAAADPNLIQVRQLYLDPAIEHEFMAMRTDLARRTDEAAHLRALQEAATFSQDSKTGQALLTKAKQLVAENEELGRQQREGPAATQGALVLLERHHADELRRALVEVREHAGYLEEENEELGMLATLNQRRIQYMVEGQGKPVAAAAAAPAGRDHGSGQRARPPPAAAAAAAGGGGGGGRDRLPPAERSRDASREQSRDRSRERERERARAPERRERGSSNGTRDRDRDRAGGARSRSRSPPGLKRQRESERDSGSGRDRRDSGGGERREERGYAGRSPRGRGRARGGGGRSGDRR